MNAVKHAPFASDKRILDSIKLSLSSVSTYSKDDEMFAFDRDGHVHVGYNTNRPNAAAEFNLQIDGDICYILSLGVRRDFRRKGIGRKMVAAIRDICREHGVRRLVTTPSGQGMKFWPAVGFRPGAEEHVLEYELGASR